MWFPLTDQLWLEWASFGSDRISAEVYPSQFSQRFERFDVADLIFFEVELSRQVSQRFKRFEVADLIVGEAEISQVSQRFERFEVADLIVGEAEISQVSQGF